MNSLFISLDLGTNSSGNIVASRELEFLKSISDNTIQLGYREISPNLYNLPDTPFLVDYLAMEYVSRIDLSNIDLTHFYSTPFPQTIKYLKAKNVKVSCMVAAHDRRESIREFENLGYQYPFSHISDDRLWQIFSGDIREADIVITPSKSSAEFLKKEGANRVEVIPHGTNIPNEKDIKPFPEQFRVGNLGSWGPDKGLKYLIQAWESLNYQDSKLVFAGSQSESFGESFIKQFNPHAKYHLAGFVPNIADFYNYISIYIQPSVVEGFGMEVLESMSYGRPVICSEGAGAADVVTDGEDGFVVSRRNIGAIAEKIKYFKDDPKEIERMGKNARIESLNYSWDKIKKRYINTWKNLLNESTKVNMKYLNDYNINKSSKSIFNRPKIISSSRNIIYSIISRKI